MIKPKFKPSTPYKIAAATMLAIALSGCGASANVKASGASPAASGGNAAAGSSPTSGAVVASANSGSPLVAGTAPAVSQAQINNGATPGTQGVAGMSVSVQGAYNNATTKGTIGAVTFDPSFTLTSVGSISAGTATSLTINSANATTTGSSLTITQDATHTVDSSITNNPDTQLTVGWLDQPTTSSDQEIFVMKDAGYSYTQYGDWYQCSANCAGSGTTTDVGGFFVRGDSTAPANIPTTGTYTYNGSIAGVSIDAAGYSGEAAAGMTATANFATRSIAFVTANTMIMPDVGPVAANSNLNMSGTLTYAAGQNLFSGTVKTANNALSGTAAGRFYGPAAQEIGGLFALTGTGGAYIGSFIGK